MPGLIQNPYSWTEALIFVSRHSRVGSTERKASGPPACRPIVTASSQNMQFVPKRDVVLKISPNPFLLENIEIASSRNCSDRCARQGGLNQGRIDAIARRWIEYINRKSRIGDKEFTESTVFQSRHKVVKAHQNFMFRKLPLEFSGQIQIRIIGFKIRCLTKNIALENTIRAQCNPRWIESGGWVNENGKIIVEAG